jgi:hypothetical protein
MLSRRCAGPSTSSGEDSACLGRVGSMEEVVEQAVRCRPRGGVARVNEGQVVMDRPSVSDFSAGQGTVKHRPQFCNRLYA